MAGFEKYDLSCPQLAAETSMSRGPQPSGAHLGVTHDDVPGVMGTVPWGLKVAEDILLGKSEQLHGGGGDNVDWSVQLVHAEHW